MKTMFMHRLATFTIASIGIVAPVILSHAQAVQQQAFIFGDPNTPGNVWELSDPFDPKASPKAGQAVADARGRTVRRYMTVPGSPKPVLVTKRFVEVRRIVWRARPKIMEEAIFAVQRGEADKAQTLIEPVVFFFSTLKKVPGNLWLDAASIKLDALVLLKNDNLITAFIRELESGITDVDEASVKTLQNRIKLAKLEQAVRRGNFAEALRDADVFIKETSDPAILANLHLIKGDALLNLRRYEDAMTAYLRISVFYGGQGKYMPASKLGAAKAFRGMNTPANKHLQLDSVANRYLNDLIAQYPVTPEAEIAKGILSKDAREALAQKDAAALEAAQKAGTDGGGAPLPPPTAATDPTAIEEPPPPPPAGVPALEGQTPDTSPPPPEAKDDQ